MSAPKLLKTGDLANILTVEFRFADAGQTLVLPPGTTARITMTEVHAVIPTVNNQPVTIDSVVNGVVTVSYDFTGTQTMKGGRYRADVRFNWGASGEFVTMPSILYTNVLITDDMFVSP